MGADHSKVDSEKIKINVQQLKEKINKQNEVIDSYLNSQFTKALDIYSEEIRKSRNNGNLRKEIFDVKQMLKDLPTQEGEPVQYFRTDWCQQLEMLETKINQLLKGHEVSRQQYQAELNEIIELSKKFDKASTSKKHDKIKQARKQIPCYFLELFILYSPLQVTNNEVYELYEDFQSILNNICNYKDDKKLMSSNFSPNDYDFIQKTMKEIKSKIKELQKIIENTEICINELKKQNATSATTSLSQNISPGESTVRSSGKSLQKNVKSSQKLKTGNKNQSTTFFVPVSQPQNNKIQNKPGNNKKNKAEEMLKEIGNIVNMQEENAQTFIASTNSSEYEQRRKQLINLEKMLKKVPEEGKEIREKKHIILTRITNALKTLEENACQNNHKLVAVSDGKKNTKNETNNFINKSTSFDKKAKISRRNETYVIKKVDNEKYQTQENEEKTELWSVKDALAKHTTVVQRNLHDLGAYQKERNEILILQHRLDKLITKNSANEKIKDSLITQVTELLKIVDQKISEEQEVLNCLTNLQQIDDQINNIRKSSSDTQTKIKALNDCQKNLSRIHNSNEKVRTKKIKVEENLKKPIEPYNIRSSQQDNIWYKQSQTDKSKKNAHQLTHPPSNHEDRSKTICLLEAIPIEETLKRERTYISKETTERNISQEEIRSCINRLRNVENEINKIAKFDANPITKMSHLEECRRKLNDIISPSTEIDIKKSKILDNLQNHIDNFKVEMALDNELHKIRSSVKKYEAEVLQFEHAKSNEMYERKRDEIINLIKKLENIRTFNTESESEKIALISRCKKILDNLNKKTYENKEIKKSFDNLQRINNEVIEIANSNTDHSTKLNCLKECRKKVNDIVYVNEEIQNEIRQLVAKISSLEENIEEYIKEKKKISIQESSKSRLYKIQTQVDQRKQEVSQFKYPTSSQNYKIKRKEIANLLEELKNIPTEWSQEDKEKNVISKEIYQLLEILDKNADVNEGKLNYSIQEEINRYFQYLQNIENNVDDIRKSNLAAMMKLKTLGDYKKKVMDLKEFDNDLLNNKKIEILKKINRIEEQLKNEGDYNVEMKKIISSMEKYKKESLNFNYPQSSKAYERKREEIFGLLQKLESIQNQFGLNNMEIMRMKNDIIQISEDLKKKAYDNDLSNQYLELIQEIDNEITAIVKADMDNSHKLRSLNECKKQMNSIITSNDEVLYEKQELINKIKKHERDLKTTNEKQDSNVSKSDSPDSIHILDVHEQFDNIKALKNANNKCSIEFINDIKMVAKHMENEVQQYKGSNYSLQYLVIDEKLMNLLEELDKIKCQQNPELLDEKIKTINYIKDLQTQLDKNATRN